MHLIEKLKNMNGNHLVFIHLFKNDSCLSPRSAYFYEFPPNAEGRENKKRTTLARLLKGLKTVNRRDRNNQQNTAAAQARAANDRLRHFQTINGGHQHSFEETIHRYKKPVVNNLLYEINRSPLLPLTD
uniref:Uncharacterized protein n=1 Tax=Glossina brevipalpis TaxID=37001 RepID=A0A1A9WDR8_9MUSC